MRLRHFLPALLALLVAGGIAIWFGRPAPAPVPGDGSGEGDRGKGPVPPPGGPAREKWTTEPVRKTTLPRTEGFPARVKAPRPLVITTPIRGTPVQKVLRHAGDAVKKGDVLVVLEPGPWRKVLADAEKGGDAPLAARAKEALAALEIRSPSDGIVYRMEAIVGEMPLFLKGEPLPLVTLYDWALLSFEGSAPAALADLLRDGAEVSVRTGKSLPTLATVVRRGDPGPDGAIPLEVRPAVPPGEAPEPGSEAWIHVTTGMQDVLVVPAAALRIEGGRAAVHVVGVAGDLQPRPVVVGRRLPGGLVEVSGVRMGEGVAVWK